METIETSEISTSQVTTHNDSDEALFFDELGSKPTKSEKKESKAAKEESPKKEAKGTNLPAEVDEALKGNMPKDEDKEGKKDEKKAATKKEPESKESKTEKDGKEEAEKKVEAKKRKYRAGDKELDIEEDAVFSQSVGGKEEQVSLRDLLDNYSGKQDYSRKYQQFDSEKKALLAEREKYMSLKNETEEKIKSIMSEEDPELRFFHMARLAGKEPLDLYRKFMTDNYKLFEQWATMSETEREASLTGFENKILKFERETRETNDRTNQAKAAVEKEISDLRAAHQIESDEYVKHFEYVSSLVKEGKLPKEHLTPKFVAESLVKERIYSAAETALKEQNISLPEATRAKQLVDLVEISFARGLKPEKLAQVVSQIWGTGKIEKIVKEKKEQREEFLSGKKESKRSQVNEDVWSFDQI